MSEKKVKNVNGKNKGSNFERKIANLLSEKFKDYLGIEKGFRRNPDSGSFYGGQNQSRTETYGTEYAVFGDLICPRSFRFSIECKHYKSPPSFQSMMDKKIPMWDKWLMQATQDSIKSGKDLMLVIKYNNVKEFVITNVSINGLSPWLIYDSKFCYSLDEFLANDVSFYFVE